MRVSSKFSFQFGDGFAGGGLLGVEDSECVLADSEVLERCERARSVMLADAAMVFAVGGVSGQVQFVLDAPVSTVECEQAMFVGLVSREAGDVADGFLWGFRPFGAGAAHHEDLCGEREVDPASGDGGGDDAAGADPPVGFFNRAEGRGKNCAPTGALRSACAGLAGCLLS